MWGESTNFLRIYSNWLSSTTSHLLWSNLGLIIFLKAPTFTFPTEFLPLVQLSNHQPSTYKTIHSTWRCCRALNPIKENICISGLTELLLHSSAVRSAGAEDDPQHEPFLCVSTIPDTSTTRTPHFPTLSPCWMVFIDQRVIQSVSRPLRVEPSPFMSKNKRAGHEKKLDGWVKGRYLSAARLKEHSTGCHWIEAQSSAKREGIITSGTSILLRLYLLPSISRSGITQLGSITITCECLRKGLVPPLWMEGLL